MKLLDLKLRFRHRPIFRISDLHPTRSHSKHELVQLNRWVKEGHIIRIIRGVYTLPDHERGVGLDLLWLATNLYAPSYISCEYALSYYGLIPEAVGTVTCVSTRKTAVFSTPMGRFSYHALKQENFFGFTTVKTAVASQEFWIAVPEKAVIDFIYLCVPRTASPDAELFTQGYRFQNLSSLNKDVFADVVARFTVKTARVYVETFQKLLEQGDHDD